MKKLLAVLLALAMLLSVAALAEETFEFEATEEAAEETAEAVEGEETEDEEAEAEPEVPQRPTLENGSRGTAVRYLQARLAQLGFYTMRVDGAYGSGSAAAVSAFEAFNDLPVTGIATPEVQALIYSVDAKGPLAPDGTRLLAPNGLPGVPVSADGNYVDANGRQWLCDTLDFTTGEYIQNVYTYVARGTETIHAYGKSFGFNMLGDAPVSKEYAGDAIIEGLSEKFAPSSGNAVYSGAKNDIFVAVFADGWANQIRFYSEDFETEDDVRMYLQSCPQFVYRLETPITRTLSTREIFDRAETLVSGSVTLDTPNGLPGVLVTEGGNFTDESGREWLCDEIDFTARTYTRNVATYEATGEETVKMNGKSFRFTLPEDAEIPYTYADDQIAAGLSTDFDASSASAVYSGSKERIFVATYTDGWARQISFYSSEFRNEESAANYLAGHPRFAYRIAEPEVISLTENELIAYKYLEIRGEAVSNTPNGLPGVPVQEGGNYVDEEGQAWLCDEVDVDSGIYTKNVFAYTASGSESVQAYGKSFGFNLPEEAPAPYEYAADAITGGWSDSFTASSANAVYSGAKDKIFNVSLVDGWAKQVRLYSDAYNSVEDVQAALKTNPTFIYVMAEPVQLELTSVERAVYAALVEE